MLWGGNLWTMGYYVNTVGQYGNLKMITNYVKNQGHKDYNELHAQIPSLFDLKSIVLVVLQEANMTNTQ